MLITFSTPPPRPEMHSLAVHLSQTHPTPESAVLLELTVFACLCRVLEHVSTGNDVTSGEELS